VDLETVLGHYRPDVENELRHVLSAGSLPMYDMMRYHLGWVDVEGNPRQGMPGKRLRPCLCLYACEAVGGDWRRALPAAAALELIHNFSLIHDDIEDESAQRRGRPTVWHIWGKPQAINTGDGMHVLARQSLLRLIGTGIDPRRFIQASSQLEEACIRLCEGQYLDISFENRVDIGVKDYLQMINGKTAALFRCSLVIGALVGMGHGSQISYLGRYGTAIGMLFQVYDDMLGIWGDSSQTGKSATSDIERKKKTLPIIYAFENTSDDDLRKLCNIYQRDVIELSDVDFVLKLLDLLNTRQYMKSMVDTYYDIALTELEAADISKEAKDGFKAITDSLVKREN